MSLKPKISIIIPTFNRSKLLNETLQSVYKQSFKHWECLVIDDGSEDGTSKLMKFWCARDSRFQYHYRPKSYTKGPSGCRNFGLLQSSGAYIQWLDDDDLLSEKKLELQFEVLEDNSKNNIGICDWDYYWGGKIINLQNSFEKLAEIDVEFYYHYLYKNQSFVPIHAFLIPKSVCTKSGGWNEDLTFNDDAEFINRILLQSEKIFNVKSCYVLYRNHSDMRFSRGNNVGSLLKSYSLMDAQLDNKKIKIADFLKWKLLSLFHKYYNDNSQLLEQYSDLFRKYNVDLRYALYYKSKYLLYRMVYPVYKKIKSKDR